MTEKAITFGLDNGFIGVISEPEGNAVKDAPILIILNSGLLHKIGPFRLSVDVARTVQKEGYTVLRFDLSGIGDSKMQLRDSEGDLAVVDVKTAMDYLYKCYGVEKFVLMGLCSGSDDSHRTAVADDRVIGTINLDGYGYRNINYYFHYYGRRLRSLKFLTRKLMPNHHSNENEGTPNQANAYSREFPPEEQVASEFSILSGRNVKMLYIYTGGVDEYYIYKQQLRDVFSGVDFKDNLELEYYPYANHTYSRVNSRKRVVNRVVDWMKMQF